MSKKTFFGIWVPAQRDRNLDEVPEGWVHDCGKVMLFVSIAEATIETEGLEVQFIVKRYDESGILTDV